MHKLYKTVTWLAIFSIAMGFMEAAVVIYLRELYYPHGFSFPLATIPPNVAVIEFLREAATVIMLAAIGIVTGRNLAERFSFFLFCFAVWDLFYYIVLKVFLDWPESLLTWDILFLIPFPWIGPVLAPCIISLTMIVLTLAVVYFHRKDILVTINKKEWALLVIGSLIIITSFVVDYISFVSHSNNSFWTPNSRERLFAEFSTYVPKTYNWLLFALGELSIITGIILMILRHKKYHPLR